MQNDAHDRLGTAWQLHSQHWIGRLSDAEKIYALVNDWAEKGEILQREFENIIHGIQNFVVAEIEGEVVGCASLYIYEKDLAEIRSLVIDPQFHQQGQGKA